MSKKNYDHYTSQGANLQQAHTEYAEWHESNHHSFFNMNNAMGLFKIIIIAGIILIVVIALSPLFKFLTSLLGAGEAGLHFLTDLLKMCETIGVCNLTAAGQAKLNSIDPGSLKPGMAFAGTCDDNSPAANKGTKTSPGRCQKVEEPISDTSPPPPPCGSRTSSLCFWGLLGWIFMAPIMALLGGLWGLLGCKGFSKKLPGNWCTDEEVSKAKGEESKVKEGAKDVVDEATRDADPIEPDNDAKNKEGEAIDSAGDKYRDKLPKELPSLPKYPQKDPSDAMKDFYDPPKNEGDPWTLKDNAGAKTTWEGGTPKEGEASWTDFQKAFVKACGGKPIVQQGDGHGYTWDATAGNKAFMSDGTVTEMITNTGARATSQNMMGKSIKNTIDLQIDQNNELRKQLATADEARAADLNREIKANEAEIEAQRQAEKERQAAEDAKNEEQAGEDADSFPKPEEEGEG